MKKWGLVLLNLGTPENPSPEAVRVYLKEFLMDPRVIDIPFLFRWFLVNQIILRSRPQSTSELYKKIWTKEGSPLLVFSRELVNKIQDALGSTFVVVLGMRYGNPSIERALAELKEAGVEKILVVPLYPQYSLAATQSSIEQCLRIKKKLKMTQDFEFYPAFYEAKGFIAAFGENMRRVVDEKRPEKVIFSFHGVPERHVRKTDLTKSHCLASDGCCEAIVEVNKNCYRAQCFATARSLAQVLGLHKDQYHVAFQSRLGRTPWVKPYSDILYQELAAQGIKTIAVVCPSFVADCLETLEEVAIRGRNDFIQRGGQDLYFVPSLNASPTWVKSLSEMIRVAVEKY